MLKKILTTSLTLFSISSFAQVNIGAVEQEYINNGKAFNAYNQLFEGSRKYKTDEIYSKFSLSYDDEKNKISGENGLNSDKSVDKLWRQKYFESIFFMFNGFVDHYHDKKGVKIEAVKDYQQKSKDFFAKKSHGLYSQMTTADYAFNYNIIGVLKAFVNSQNILKDCKSKEDKDKCISTSAEKLKNSNDLFEKINGECLNDNTTNMNKCIIKEIDTTDFSKAMAFENYIVGYYLYDITNQK
jgi:hypothetical protein